MIIDKRHISTAEMREAVLKAYHVVGRPNPHKSDIDSIAIGCKRLTNPTYQFAVDFAEVGG